MYNLKSRFPGIWSPASGGDPRRGVKKTRSSAIAEGPRDASCQLKSCQLPRNCAETTCTSPDQVDVMKLEDIVPTGAKIDVG